MARNYNRFACNDEASRTHDSAKDGLPCAVAIVKQTLAIGIVYVDHREVEKSCFFARERAMNTRGGFFATANQILAVFAAFAVKKRNKIPAVVDDEIGVAGKCLFEVFLVLFQADAVKGVNLESLDCERCRDVILGGKGIAS